MSEDDGATIVRYDRRYKSLRLEGSSPVERPEQSAHVRVTSDAHESYLLVIGSDEWPHIRTEIDRAFACLELMKRDGARCSGGTAMSVTRVVNMRHEEYDVRIDRRSKWGNPFVIGPDGDREEVIAKYRLHVTALIAADDRLIDELWELRGKRLGCWCAPERCHGEVLIEAIRFIYGEDAE